MKKFISQYIIQITIIMSAVILVWVSANLKWGDERWNSNLDNDQSGLYAYLPAIFIYHDLSFDFYKDRAESSGKDYLFYNRNKEHNNGVVNKYYAGTALAQMPFFLIGHCVSKILSKPLDGYSSYYLIFIQVAAIFYALLGQLFLVGILSFYRVSKKITALVIFAAVFGTNIYYYVTNEPGMSHVYSFAFITLFAYCVIRFFDKPRRQYFLMAMFALGIVILIRPVNILILLSIPFLAGDWQKLKNGFQFLFKSYWILITGIIITTLVVSIQLIIYKIQTGDFIVYSYAGEGFNFSDPNILNFILSYRKGFLVYTPLFFISLMGMYIIHRQSQFQFYSLVLFLFIVIYILSSWWQWYYGGSFGSRAFIDYYVFMFIPAALWLYYGKFKKLFVWLTAVLVIVCQIQTIQYRSGYIHWSDMTKELYWDNFLRIDKVIKGDEKQWK
jgi:hypothetical protein